MAGNTNCRRWWTRPVRNMDWGSVFIFEQITNLPLKPTSESEDEFSSNVKLWTGQEGHLGQKPTEFSFSIFTAAINRSSLFFRWGTALPSVTKTVQCDFSTTKGNRHYSKINPFLLKTIIDIKIFEIIAGAQNAASCPSLSLSLWVSQLPPSTACSDSQTQILFIFR